MAICPPLTPEETSYELKPFFFDERFACHAKRATSPEGYRQITMDNGSKIMVKDHPGLDRILVALQETQASLDRLKDEARSIFQ